MSESRRAGYDIQAEFIKRWSPRAFTGEDVPREALMRGFEAARWSPSGGNSQPWRFLFARRDSPAFARYAEFLAEANRAWARHAGALVILLARKDFEMNGKRIQSSSYSFDAGAGWQSFALQMSADGWATHAMAGFDKDRVRGDLNVPENYSVEVMIAVGRRGDPASLPEPYRARETPSSRDTLEALVGEGLELPSAWRAK